MRLLRLAALLFGSMVFVGHASATITQVDGTIVPVLSGGACEGGDLQTCFNEQMETGLNAITDASIRPEVFFPSLTPVTCSGMPSVCTGGVRFLDLAEGAGYENSFGYYNVGADLTSPSSFHPIMGCGVTAATHTSEVPGYVQQAEQGTVVRVDFVAEGMAGRYTGGLIGFYLITPDGHSPNCGDVRTGPGPEAVSIFAASDKGRVYYTQKDLNNDGDYIHHLVYQSKVDRERFYFGFEDLFRGGDNDFEDMAMQITGLIPPCIPEAEICDGIDNDCDDLVDGLDDSLSDDGASCSCDGTGGLTCEGGNRMGPCRTGTTVCVGSSLICRSTVAAVTETCNLADDNCNGVVDDNPSDATGACDGTDSDLCREGTNICVSGVIQCSDATGPNPELCDGVDQDCDTRFDEGATDIGGACDGADGDLCNEGTVVCSPVNSTMGAKVCNDNTGTIVETCNNLDDDCDTRVDEFVTGIGNACSVGVGECIRTGATVCRTGSIVCGATPGASEAERCNSLDDDCDGRTDESFNLGQMCVAPGACGPGLIECASATTTRCSTAPGGTMSGVDPELCNNVDDDCDTRTDEGLTDIGACGEDTGECSEGRLRCVGGMPVCQGGAGPLPEECDLLDNDCDGDTDEAPAPGELLPGEGEICGVTAGECSPGHFECDDGELVCNGGTGGSAELCDTLDNDCDDRIDETPTDVGEACGPAAPEFNLDPVLSVCRPGATICLDGEEVCAGAVNPATFERCNGLDDDCDFNIDEMTREEGRVCGSAMGTCTPGITVCRDGMVACDGATTGSGEVCDGVDNDCDTRIDEAPLGNVELGMVCGGKDGICTEGTTVCRAGMLQCDGAVTPGTEVCNGLDDDCDGDVDEGDLCGEAECGGEAGCALPCAATEFPCPLTQTCVEGYCVEDTCFNVNCAPEEDGTKTTCVDGDCVPLCETLDCAEPNVCRRTDGACVGNNCFFLPYLCGEDELCRGGECAPDACAGVACDENEFCIAGDCRRSCADVSCSLGEACRGGSCEDTGCDFGCGVAEVCSAGACVANPCTDVTCELGETCDPSSGDCVSDPCIGVMCPSGAVCRMGECVSDVVEAPDAGVPDAGADGATEPRRVDVLAAGGGGASACATAAPSSRGSLIAPLFLLGVLALAGFRRRRLTALAAALTALLVSGCQVDPLCLGQCDEDASEPDDDGGVDGGDGATDSGRIDACVPIGVDEICNGSDDDCNGNIDEGFDLTSDGRNCGECGNSCEQPGAQTQCDNSRCVFIECFPGYVDVDDDAEGDPEESNGCEYMCFPTNEGVEACDEIDNDCDNEVDEDFDLEGDEQNCGMCGQTCVFFRATGTCEDATCGFDPMTDCDAGFIDQNDIPSDGCEVECTVTNDGVEICDGLDNDCNGPVDEPFDLEENADNCGVCGNVCTFPNATPHCTEGECTFDPMVDCEPGFSDRDGIELNGCEYPCVPTEPADEVCDGVDNDCNGIVDRDTTDEGGACNAAPGGVPAGICTATGSMQCIAGTLVCLGAPGARSERCNMLDDDCDGDVDEEPGDVGRVCQAPVGACSAGFGECQSGAIVCVREVVPSPELCNGIDDDCDTRVDETPTDATLGDDCGVDTGACDSGTIACVSGALRCSGGVGPTLEVCNNVDDDCDGTPDNAVVDDGGPCGTDTGVCVQGSLACVSGALVCQGGISGASETCDSEDDDCDGLTDEAIAPTACYSGPSGTANVGRCRRGTAPCSGGTTGACVGQILPTAELCNNINDDCDANTDETVTQACYTGSAATNGVGLCHGGTQSCAAGTFGACTGQVLPTTETCNNQDQDCDGRIDESITQACYTGLASTRMQGICRDGTQQCLSGSFGSCIGQTLPLAFDRCGDLLDTDCDGLGDVAEGCIGPLDAELRLDGAGSGAGVHHSFDVQVAVGGATTGNNVYVVWSDLRNGNSDIYLSRSTDAGLTFATPQNLTSDFDDRAVAPVITVARNGSSDRVFIAWTRVQDGRREVFISHSTDSGATFTRTQMNSPNDTDNFKPSIAVNANGTRFIVAWEQLDVDTLSRNIRYRNSTDVQSGNLNVPNAGDDSMELLVNLNSTFDSSIAGKPVTAFVNNSNRFVVVWREARDGDDTFEIYSQRTNGSGGLSAGNERRLTSNSDDRVADDPRIVTVVDNVYAIWQEFSTTDASDVDIRFARSAGTGNTYARSWSTPVTLDDPSGEVSSASDASISIDPQAASDTDDRIYVAFADNRDGSTIYLTRSADSGATWVTPTRASQTGGSTSLGVASKPRIVWAGNSGGSSMLVIAYLNRRPLERTRVRVAASDDQGVNWLYTDPPIDGGGGDTDNPAIARITGTGVSRGAVIPWLDFRAGTRINGDVYRVRVGRP